MSCYAKEISQAGLRLFELGNDLVKVVVSPVEGGKVRHLVNLGTGRDYCWQMPDPPTLSRYPGMDYTQADCTGIDDCLPTIAACNWNGRDLPDHGEIWTGQMETEWVARSKDTVSLGTSLDLPFSAMRFRRVVSILDGSPVIKLHYELSSTSEEDQDFIWALHPLLAFRAGEQVILPSVHRVITDESAAHTPLAGFGRELDWPVPAEGLDLSKLKVGEEGRSSIKFFSEKMQVGWAALHEPARGDLLAFLFDPSVLPYVGVWINRGGWAGYQHVAIEPTNGRPDGLDIAAGKWHSAQKLGAGQCTKWELSLLCTTHKDGINDIQPDGRVS
ncbi:MAG: hypothetical protein V1800_00475 [Candidatus Latescibacterota bacterium]